MFKVQSKQYAALSLLGLPCLLLGCPGKSANDDSDCGAQSTWYPDADGDGFGNVAASFTACSAYEGAVADGTDCDDGDAAMNPGAAEVCDGLDNDCDGEVDANASDILNWYTDGDGDGFGDPLSGQVACEAPTGTVSDATDCDDTRASVNPGHAELCDGLDNDCDAASGEAGQAAFWDTSGVGIDYTSTLFGDAEAPAEVTLATAGTLYVCPGVWYANIEVAADVTIAGVGVPEDVRLNGAQNGSVVTVATDGVAVRIEGLTLENGSGNEELDPLSTGASVGGALTCVGGEDRPELMLSDVVVTASDAFLGGGLGVFYCDVTLDACTISYNTSEGYGGGMFAHQSTVNFDGSLVLGNTAPDAGGLYANESSVICTGSAAMAAGFISNSVDGDGGAITIDSSQDASESVTLVECDLGESDTEADNLPEDIFIYAGIPGHFLRYLYGDDTTVTCDASRCGILNTPIAGSTAAGSNDARGIARGNIFTVTAEATLESFEAYLEHQSATDRNYWYLLSTEDPSVGIWVVEARRNHYPGATAAGYYSSNTLGIPLIPGLTYATVVAWESDTWVTYYYEEISGTVDLGMGTIDHYRYYHSGFSTSSYSGDTVTRSATYESDPYAIYAQRYNWSY